MNIVGVRPPRSEIPKPIVVGLLGRRGSGKSTAAEQISKEWGAMRVSLSRPLKELAKILWDFTEEQVNGTQEQKETVDSRWGLTPRECMIRLGDGARHALYDRVWFDIVARQIMQDFDHWSAIPRHDAAFFYATHPRVYVIEDVRYPNEASLLRMNEEFIGCVVKLECPDAMNSGFEDAPSERSVDLVPEHLLNAIITSHKTPGSVDLKDKVHRVVRQLISDVREGKL